MWSLQLVSTASLGSYAEYHVHLLLYIVACEPIWDDAGGANLQLSTRDEQLDVLAKVLSAGEDEAGIEVAAVTDDVTRTKASLAHRTTGNLAALSGAHGLTYMEVKLQPTICCTWTLKEHVAGIAFYQRASSCLRTLPAGVHAWICLLLLHTSLAGVLSLCMYGL